MTITAIIAAVLAQPSNDQNGYSFAGLMPHRIGQEKKFHRASLMGILVGWSLFLMLFEEFEMIQHTRGSFKDNLSKHDFIFGAARLSLDIFFCILIVLIVFLCILMCIGSLVSDGDNSFDPDENCHAMLACFNCCCRVCGEPDCVTMMNCNGHWHWESCCGTNERKKFATHQNYLIQ